MLKLTLTAFYLVVIIATGSSKPNTSNVNVVCYHGTWATYRNGNGKFGVENIDPFLCTHLIYAFFGIEESGNIRIIDPYLDLEDNYGRNNIRKFNLLKQQNPTLKTLAAVGGWNEGSKNFSIVAADPEKRKRFVRSVVQFIQRHGFDGLDLDWEYPNQRHNLATNDDKTNFIHLIKELKEEFEPFDYILSVAVASAEISAAKSYDIPEMIKYVDLLNILSYDLHGPWDDVTGMNSPLYPSLNDLTPLQKQLSVNEIIKYWIEQGAPKEKIVLGVAFYGRSFTLKDPNQHSVGSPHLGRGIAGQYSTEPGVLGYNEICEKLLKEEWNQEWDSEQMEPYIYKGQQWISYTNLKSLSEKAQFVRDNNLGGIMIWSIESDDFNKHCHNESFPLLKTINRILFGTETVNGLIRSRTPDTFFQLANDSKGFYLCKNIHNGYARDDEDCSKFYSCVEGMAYEFKCPGTLLFNVTTGVCDYPLNVNCDVQNHFNIDL